MFSINRITESNSRPTDQYNINFSELTELLKRVDFESIIKDKELFWSLFCKIFSEKKVKKDNCFDIQVNGDLALVLGRDHIIKHTQKFVELLRTLALESFEAKSAIKTLFIPISTDLFVRKPSNTTIDLTDWLTKDAKDKFSWDFYIKFNKPFLPCLFETLKLNYDEVESEQFIKTDLYMGSEKREVMLITVTPDKNTHFSFPIKPAELPASDHPNKPFYDAYKLGMWCDFSLISSEGKHLSIHKSVLGIYGGKCFQTLLSQKMRENNEQAINLNYSYEVLSFFCRLSLFRSKGFREAFIARKKN